MSLSHTATIGLVWIAIASIVSKVASVLALLVLGWLISVEEFALYALAFSVSSLFLAVKNGGLQQLLIQRGSEKYKLTSSLYFKIGLYFNLAVFLCVVIIAPTVGEIYSSEAISTLLYVIALSLPFNAFTLIFRARLSIDHQFHKIAKFDAFSSIVRHLSTVIFALLGFGAFSFALALICVSVYEVIVGWYYVREMPDLFVKLNYRYFKVILQKVKWVILATISTTIVLQGDYLVIGLLEDKKTVGYYFFGFQLVASIAVIFSSSIQTVLMPLFSKLNNDKDRQVGGYLKLMRIVIPLNVFFSILLALISPILISFIWGGKWDEAIYVAQLMALSLSTILLTPIARSILEAQAKWKLVSLFLTFDAICTLVAALLGAYFGGLNEIALFVGLYRFVFSTVYLVAVSKVLNYSDRSIMFIVLRVLLIIIVSGFVAFAIQEFVIGSLSFVVNEIVFLIVFSVSYWVLMRFVCREYLTELFGYLNPVINRFRNKI